MSIATLPLPVLHFEPNVCRLLHFPAKTCKQVTSPLRVGCMSVDTDPASNSKSFGNVKNKNLSCPRNIVHLTRIMQLGIRRGFTLFLSMQEDTESPYEFFRQSVKAETMKPLISVHSNGGINYTEAVDIAGCI